jgi:hypothetical protein
MPRYSQDFDIDPARNPDREREDDRDRDREDATRERSVMSHAEEAEEAEIAEEDILEMADLEDELEAQKGENPNV